IVAADGQHSPLRQAAGIAARAERLPQAALIAIMRHELPHHDVSTELHLRGGPCTLVPLRRAGDTQADAGARDGGLAHASSLVWMMPTDEAQRLAAQDDGGFG